MEDSAEQLDFFGEIVFDFNDELELPPSTTGISWREFLHQIALAAQNRGASFFSDQTICANMFAWSIFFRQSAYNDLLIALEEEELPDSFSIKDLRNKIYSYRVYAWVDKQPEVSENAENPWGDLEPIRHVSERCAKADMLLMYAYTIRETGEELPSYLQEYNQELYQVELEDQIKIYISSVEEKLDNQIAVFYSSMEQLEERERKLAHREREYERVVLKHNPSKLFKLGVLLSAFIFYISYGYPVIIVIIGIIAFFSLFINPS